MIAEKLNVERILLFVATVFARLTGSTKQPHQMSDEDFDIAVEGLYKYVLDGIYNDNSSLDVFLSMCRNPNLEYGNINYPDWWSYVVSDINNILHEGAAPFEPTLSINLSIENYHHNPACHAEDRCIRIYFKIRTTAGTAHNLTVTIRNEGLTLNRKSVGDSKRFSNVYQENLVRYNAVLSDDQRKSE